MGDRRTSVVLVAAHPDDEVIGAGGHLASLDGCLIVHVTDGAPRDLRDASANGFATREQYAEARRVELLAALAVAGLGEDRACSLGIVDQEASRDLAALSRALAAVLRELRPAAVLTHPYEGGHPDHDATAFAVHAACRMLDPAPAVHEFACYYSCGGRMVTGSFLPYFGCPVWTVELPPEARERKRRMLGCFVTQARTVGQFSTAVERFREAPRYDFSRPAHGEIYYDWFPWGIKSHEWIEEARRALGVLGLC